VCADQATWKEPDGIIVVDYNWCIGCRYCMAPAPMAPPVQLGRTEAGSSRDQPEYHYLGNRPRVKGVVEKCTFCIQRTRKDRAAIRPAWEACPVGARKFGKPARSEERDPVRMSISGCSA